MRIHTDKITFADLYRAAVNVTAHRHATVYVDGLTLHASRSRRAAWEVKLTGDGTHSRRRAATWDQWGWFLAHLFDVDPEMIVGTPGRPTYASADDFHARTDDKFRAGQSVAELASRI
jgi:hypothetical protein